MNSIRLLESRGGSYRPVAAVSKERTTSDKGAMLRAVPVHEARSDFANIDPDNQPLDFFNELFLLAQITSHSEDNQT